MVYSVSTLKYNDEEAAFKLRKDIIHPVVKKQKGYRSVQFFKCLDGSGEYLIIIAWESKEDRDAYVKSKDHDGLKEKQWPLMSEKISTKEYELILD